MTLTNSESNEKNNDESKSQKNIIGSESESKSQKDEKNKMKMICILSSLGTHSNEGKMTMEEIPKNNFNEIIYKDKKNDEIYNKICKDKISQFFWGKRDTVFLTFGLNNSGKTHLIYGSSKDPGFIPLSFKDFFKEYNSNEPSGNYMKFSCNFLEIYQNSFFDLLHKEGKKRIENLDGGNINAQKIHITKITDLIWVLKCGKSRITKGKFTERKGGKVYYSSVSTTIFSINIEIEEFFIKNNPRKKISFYFVDLIWDLDQKNKKEKSIIYGFCKFLQDLAHNSQTKDLKNKHILSHDNALIKVVGNFLKNDKDINFIITMNEDKYYRKQNEIILKLSKDFSNIKLDVNESKHFFKGSKIFNRGNNEEKQNKNVNKNIPLLDENSKSKKKNFFKENILDANPKEKIYKGNLINANPKDNENILKRNLIDINPQEKESKKIDDLCENIICIFKKKRKRFYNEMILNNFENIFTTYENELDNFLRNLFKKHFKSSNNNISLIKEKKEETISDKNDNEIPDNNTDENDTLRKYENELINDENISLKNDEEFSEIPKKEGELDIPINPGNAAKNNKKKKKKNKKKKKKKRRRNIRKKLLQKIKNQLKIKLMKKMKLVIKIIR